MTKTEMVDKLNGVGLGTKAALKKLEPEELSKMVAELEEGAENVGTTDLDNTEDTGSENIEGTGEVLVEDTTADEGTDEGTDEDTDEDIQEELVVEEELSSVVHQLGIFTELIYNVRKKGAKVKVENLGNGDVYVSDETPRVGNKDHRLLTGEVKVFEDETAIRLVAASQPEVKITEIK